MSSALGAQPTDDAKLELRAEELVVAKRAVAGATVRVSTVTRRIEHEVDERVAHEHLDVERVLIGRVVETLPDIREENGVTIVPVVEEVVVVERRLVLVEEVRITRRRVEARHVETAVLRRQEAVVTRSAPGEASEEPRSFSPNHDRIQREERSPWNTRPSSPSTTPRPMRRPPLSV